MKKLLPAILVLTFVFTKSEAQNYKTALGVRLSSANADVNNSVSFRQFITHNTALEGLLSFGDPVAIGVLFEKFKALSPEGLSYFWGGGGYVSFAKTSAAKTSNGNVGLGGQGVIGLDYKFNNIPLNLSLDWKPELLLVNNINFQPAAIGLSARFVFGK
jgi:hypothetical protein